MLAGLDTRCPSVLLGLLSFGCSEGEGQGQDLPRVWFPPTADAWAG